jgi:hypothetical protein
MDMQFLLTAPYKKTLQVLVAILDLLLGARLSRSGSNTAN